MKKIIASLGVLSFAAPAFAHHPMAGAPMETFAHGVLSGVGHPVLGFDHLFFVALVGIAALFTGRALMAPLGFIAAMLLGTFFVSFSGPLPMTEILIVASLVILGGLVASGRALGFAPAIGLFALAGIFHGSAYGATIASQEAAIGGLVIIGYLIGLGVTQYLIAIFAGWAAKTVWNATDAAATSPRLAGAFVAGIGVFLALETVEGAAFAALGLG